MTTILELDGEQRVEIVHQLGRNNLLAISGGRVGVLRGGIDLPVASGYSVKVELAANDTYVVSRVFRRKGVEHGHGSRENVYCDELAEVAYRASCFRSYSDTEW